MSTFYPASGYRSAVNGEMMYIGSVGYGWESSVCGQYYIRAKGIYFGSGTVDVAHDYYRGVGISVRCVKE